MDMSTIIDNLLEKTSGKEKQIYVVWAAERVKKTLMQN
jgi:hypothetical protein